MPLTYSVIVCARHQEVRLQHEGVFPPRAHSDEILVFNHADGTMAHVG